MRKILLSFFVVSAVALLAGEARAQEGDSGVGVGTETLLTLSTAPGLSLGAPTFVYDAGNFHIDALLLLLNFEDNDTIVGLGGRVFFVLHEGDRSDFSLGGGLSIIHTDHDPDAQEDETDLHLEGAAKLRAFLTRNVAVHATLGLAILLADEGSDFFGFLGQLNGSVGLTYFFW